MFELELPWEQQPQEAASAALDELTGGLVALYGAGYGSSQIPDGASGLDMPTTSAQWALWERGIAWAGDRGRAATSKAYPANTFSNLVSVACWVQPAASDTSQDTIFQIGNYESGKSRSLVLHTNILSPGDFYVGSNSNDYYTPGGKLSVGVPTHIAATVDGAPGPHPIGTIRIYINGILQPMTHAGEVGTFDLTLASQFRFGWDPGASRAFRGLIGPVAVFKRAITQADVLRHMATPWRQYQPQSFPVSAAVAAGATATVASAATLSTLASGAASSTAQASSAASTRTQAASAAALAVQAASSAALRTSASGAAVAAVTATSEATVATTAAGSATVVNGRTATSAATLQVQAASAVQTGVAVTAAAALSTTAAASAQAAVQASSAAVLRVVAAGTATAVDGLAVVSAATLRVQASGTTAVAAQATSTATINVVASGSASVSAAEILATSEGQIRVSPAAAAQVLVRVNSSATLQTLAGLPEVDNRPVVVVPSRTLVVAAQPRTLGIAAQPRTLDIAAQPRTLDIRPWTVIGRS